MNPYMRDARNRKAHAICQLLITSYEHVDTALTLSEMAEGMNELSREMAASAAGQKKPSDATWALVVSALRSLEAMQEEVAA